MTDRITPEKIAELDATHKRASHVHSTRTRADGAWEWEFVIRKPTRAEYKQWRAKINSENTASDATEQLIRKIAVLPSGEAFEAMLEDWPALAEAAVPAIKAMCGLDADHDRK
jgi:hypothetical protein